jgi:hypothetical protein
MRAKLLTAIICATVAIVAAHPAGAWLMNKDVWQTFSDPQDNFEVCFSGDFRNVPLDKGVIAPYGWNVQMSYNASTNTTCFSFAGPALPQQSLSDRPHHFGLGVGQGISKVDETREYWTRGPSETATPGGSCGFGYDSATGTASFVVSNDTSEPTVIAEAGWLALDEEPPLEMLNRDDMPGHSFNPAPIPAGTVLMPGDTIEYTVDGVAPHQTLVCFQSVAFAEPLEEDYPATVSIWTAERIEAFAGVPTHDTD